MGLYVYKQNVIGINIPTDSAPTQNSDNFITSGDLYSIINSISYNLENLQRTIKTLQTDIRTIKTLQTDISTLQQTIQTQKGEIQSLNNRVLYLESLHDEDGSDSNLSITMIDNELNISGSDAFIDDEGWLIINSSGAQVDNDGILAVLSSGGGTINTNIDNEDTVNLNGALNVNSEDLLEINGSKLQVDEDGYITL